MPLLTYPTPDFTPFTTIRSADVNGKFTAIQTLLNTTGLDDANIQNAGITRATKLKLGSANHVVINDGTGAMSSEAALAASRGGLGAAFTLSAGVAGQVPAVNTAGTAFELATPSDANSRLYSYFNAF